MPISDWTTPKLSSLHSLPSPSRRPCGPRPKWFCNSAGYTIMIRTRQELLSERRWTRTERRRLRYGATTFAERRVPIVRIPEGICPADLSPLTVEYTEYQVSIATSLSSDVQRICTLKLSGFSGTEGFFLAIAQTRQFLREFTERPSKSPVSQILNKGLRHHPSSKIVRKTSAKRDGQTPQLADTT